MKNFRILCFVKLCLCFLLFGNLRLAECLNGRDLVLTPRQGLQLKGKSIYYEEDSSEALRNQSVRPWERTLKHVTFVTLFTSAATSAASGNISKLKEYRDFLDSVYVSNQAIQAQRFGDIVTLAAGRVEKIGNGSYQFVEGSCDFECEPERVWALWQVQKIRHRDQNQRYRYEMKFSVSPFRTEASSENEVNDNTIAAAEASTGGNYNRGSANLQTYIQRDEDYPKSFGRIIYPEEIAFAQRRRDDYAAGRNFRQTNAFDGAQNGHPMYGQGNFNDYRQVTPLPQSTFLHGIFQAPPPPLPPSSERLNIGEYVKNYGVLPKPVTAPKIELFPNILSLQHKSPHANFIVPTTFRPHYQMKFPRPEIYTPTAAPNFQQDHRSDNGKMKAPLVTHHFHHHFFMPNAVDDGAAANAISSAEIQQQQLKHLTQTTSHQFYPKDIASQVTPPSSYFEHSTPSQQDFSPPAPQKISFPLTGEHVVEVTPAPMLKNPDGYSIYPVTIGPKVPLLIYEPPRQSTQRIRQKPFVQSDPMPEQIRYSEPDPLYINAAESGGDERPQVESPQTANQFLSGQIGGVRHPSSIADQLPTPQRDQDLRIPYEDESGESGSKEKSDLISTHSQKQSNKVATEQPATTTEPAAEPMVTHASTSTTSTAATTTTQSATELQAATSSTARAFNLFKMGRRISTTFAPTARTTTSTSPAPFLRSTPKYVASTTASSDFISTSTALPPLRAISRPRIAGHPQRPTTTTTEPAVLKWKPKRRNHLSSFKFNGDSEATTKKPLPKDNKARGSVLHEKKVISPNHTAPQDDRKSFEQIKEIIYATLPPTVRTEAATKSVTAAPSSHAQSSKASKDAESSYEVLTQKSISRSVSIKVGDNGAEIPILVDDEFVANEINAD